MMHDAHFLEFAFWISVGLAVLVVAGIAALVYFFVWK